MKTKLTPNRFLRILRYGFFDCLTVAVAWVCAIVLSKCDFEECMKETWGFFVGAFPLAILLNVVFGLYSKLLRYVDSIDILKAMCAGIIEAVYFGIVAIISKTLNLEWSILSALFYIIILVGGRFAYKILIYIDNAQKMSVNKKNGTRLMIIGAGEAGSMIIRDIKTSDKSTSCPICVIDDDEEKTGLMINGVKIVGTTKDIVDCAKEYKIDEIVIAIPSASKQRIKEIIEICQKTNCKTQIIPGVYQYINGKVTASSIKDIDITDLLGRDPVKVNLDEIMGYIEKKTILVTGGGGSIGSELCRQIATHNPKCLIIVDIYENNAYEIQQELKRHYPKLNLVVLIASVRDANRINAIFDKYKPQIVFHAAAHKHVPLMEESPNEAVKNNIGGTYNVADIAGKHNVERFILISTDKAVNPTNIMGATKRVCEMVIQTMDKKYETDYVAVRFGNVLGSNGSVIPLFREQIAEGGPVTITDKRIVRYFMTIPEAVTLVLQAGAYANGGEIFILDMGEPVKIYDLAFNMIKLSGLDPYVDIDIKEIGLRPGEKLYEERLMAEEGLKKTANNMISIAKPIQFDEDTLFDTVKKLVDEAYTETDKIKKDVSSLVETYKIDESQKPEVARPKKPKKTVKKSTPAK